MKSTVIGPLSAFTANLIDRLKDGKPGDVFTVEQLSEIAGRDCRHPGVLHRKAAMAQLDGDMERATELSRAAAHSGAGNLRTAIRYCVNNHGVNWQWVRGSDSIRCMNGEEVGNYATASTKSTHRRLKHTCQRMRCADLTDLSDDDKASFRVRAAQIGSLVAISSSNAHKKLLARHVQTPLDYERLLENMTK